MIPDFTKNGYLPQGIHRASRSEFCERFALFARSDRRLRICEQLERLLDEWRKSGIVVRAFVGGSLVSCKAEPNDFDCILVLRPEIVGHQLNPQQYNLASRKMARRLFGGDVVPALENSEFLDEYLEFFQTTRDGERVGIVEVEL